MRKYEYYVQEIIIDADWSSSKSKAELDAMGALGWELVEINKFDMAIFKRPLEVSILIENSEM